jgi:hypothetical protein
MIQCLCRNRHTSETEEDYAARLTHFKLARPREVSVIDHGDHAPICGYRCHHFHCPVYMHHLERMIEGDD